jgi:predicted alpha/beta-fold hydrolase
MPDQRKMKNRDFKPAWWLRSPHLQTLWPVFFKKRHKLDLINEQVELDDGDFLDICWSRSRSDKIVLVLHGLEGSLDSHYINGIIYKLEQAGYKPVLMHFRGCSGRINRLPRAYHSGETGDVAFIAEYINKKTGFYPYAVVAYSLGANVLLKWLGETGGSNKLTKAAAVSVPFRLHDAAKRLEKGLSKIYREHLLKSLRKTYVEKFKKIQAPLNVDVKTLTSFWEYDDKVTAPLHGFKGAQDYYDTCSSRGFIKHIQVPTRIIHAADDPFMFETTLPENNELNNNIDFIRTDFGGHVGFISSKSLFSPEYWCENKIIEFLEE